jgi:HAD superfamily hydrolase (TIGR01662 family)
MIEGAVFDLGSTLIRFTGDWQQVMDAGIRHMTNSLLDSGLELDTAQLTRAFDRTWQSTLKQRDVDFIERPMAELLNQVLAELGHSQVQAAVVDRALERMFSSSEEYWLPMPGVHEVLEELRQAGLRLGIISNASDAANVHRLVDKANLRPFFDPIIVSAEERIRKPDTRIFEILLQAWGLPPQRLVMTGDSLPADIVGARQVGMYSIWLTADADTPSNRAVRDKIEPDAIAEELVDVPDIIRRRGIATRQEEAQ